MDGLTKVLYEFVHQSRMGSLFQDPEYHELSHQVDLQEDKVRSFLDRDQRRELSQLLFHLAALSALESEHLFLSTLALDRELRDLF